MRRISDAMYYSVIKDKDLATEGLDAVSYTHLFYIQPDNKITKKLLENNQYLQRKEGYSRKTEGFCMVFPGMELL